MTSTSRSPRRGRSLRGCATRSATSHAAAIPTLRRVCSEEGVEQATWGGRQHFLRWAPPLWPAYERAGLAYDTSLSFADRPGFRAGICCEYPVFDLKGRRTLRLRERPLVAM